MRATAAHPGLVRTTIYHHDGSRRPADLVWALAIRLAGQDPARGALLSLHAAVGDVPGDSFAGPSHLLHTRGDPQLIGRSGAARDPGLARRLWDASEQLTGVRFSLRPVPHLS